MYAHRLGCVCVCWTRAARTSVCEKIVDDKMNIGAKIATNTNHTSGDQIEVQQAVESEALFSSSHSNHRVAANRTVIAQIATAQSKYLMRDQRKNKSGICVGGSERDRNSRGTSPKRKTRTSNVDSAPAMNGTKHTKSNYHEPHAHKKEAYHVHSCASTHSQKSATSSHNKQQGISRQPRCKWLPRYASNELLLLFIVCCCTLLAVVLQCGTAFAAHSSGSGGSSSSSAGSSSGGGTSLYNSKLLSLESILPQSMQQIKSRFNQGCVGGTKCQFFAFCWMSGGSLGASCGLLMTCCVTPSRTEIQPGFYGPVVNDPYCGRSTSKINRIVGGTDASFGQFPWQAFVQVGGSRCGGALISSRHVVTAGHCVARSQHSPSSIKVTLGDYILNSDIESIPHEVFSVVEVLLHPNFRFTPQADRYDVAVLELDRTAKYKDNIKPICLPQKDATFVGRVAYVAGWGALQAGSKLRPKVLQHVDVPVIENQVCENWHRRKGIDIRIYDEMMCAGYEVGQRDACQGDSGGPLMLNQFGVWYLVGIVSAGYSCAKQYQPGIYHRVSSSSDWISSNVYQQGAIK